MAMEKSRGHGVDCWERMIIDGGRRRKRKMFISGLFFIAGKMMESFLLQ